MGSHWHCEWEYRLEVGHSFCFLIRAVCVLGIRDIFTKFDLFKTNFRHFPMSLNALSMYFK